MTLDIRPCYAQTVINEDGSIVYNGINGPSIETEDNITYTMTSEGLALEIRRSNIILDADGYRFYGYDTGGNIVKLHNVSNVTVKNIGGFSCYEGAYLLSLVNSSNNTICYNQIWAGSSIEFVQALRFKNSSYNKIFGNCIRSVLGFAEPPDIQLINSSFNHFYGNNIGQHWRVGYLDVSGESANFWDDGYPSGGNFWGKKSPGGSDVYKGVFQNVSGGDGIIDTPNVIDDSNIDCYPLMRPFEMRHPAYTVASFNFSPEHPVAGETVVSFNASGSVGVNCTISDYVWDFGDGGSAEGVNATHIYEPYGAYNVTLAVDTEYHLSSTQTMLITVRDYPVAEFTHDSPSDLAVAQGIVFDASLSDPRGGKIVNYTWNFGDANITSTIDPVIIHSYPNLGTYDVQLSIFDDEGFNSFCSLQIMVRMSTNITISTAFSTTVGAPVEIEGTLKDFYGNNLTGEKVVLCYTSGDVDTWTLLTSDVVDNNGRYHVSWVPQVTGTFTIKAGWEGNSTHLESSNTFTSTVIEEESFFNTSLGKALLYGVPIVIIIAVIIIIYIQRRH